MSYLTKQVITNADGTTVETEPQEVAEDGGYITYDSDTATLTLGKNGDPSKVTIDNDSMDIVVDGTTAASFGESNIHLGMNSTNSIIDLCNGSGSISGNANGSAGLSLKGTGLTEIGGYRSTSAEPSDFCGMRIDEDGNTAFNGESLSIQNSLGNRKVVINDDGAYIKSVSDDAVLQSILNCDTNGFVQDFGDGASIDMMATSSQGTSGNSTAGIVLYAPTDASDSSVMVLNADDIRFSSPESAKANLGITPKKITGSMFFFGYTTAGAKSVIMYCPVPCTGAKQVGVSGTMSYTVRGGTGATLTGTIAASNANFSWGIGNGGNILVCRIDGLAAAFGGGNNVAVSGFFSGLTFTFTY